MPASVYDDLDLLYREIWGTSLHHGYWKTGKESPPEARENLIQKILTHWQPTGHLADIGCGYGTLARRLIHHHNCTVTACTSSKVQASHIPPTPSLTILTGDWLDQEITPHSLDGAISLESASHFKNFDHLLKKTHSFLKPGASWIISDWFAEGGDTPLLRHLAKTGGLPPWRTLDTFLTAARHHGFTVSMTTDLSHGVAPTWSALLKKALTLPLRSPKTIPQLALRFFKRPALLWAFPLLRFAYHRGQLSYHLIKLTHREALSSRPPP